MSFSELALCCEKSLNFDSWLLIKSKYNISSLKNIILFYFILYTILMKTLVKTLCDI